MLFIGVDGGGTKTHAVAISPPPSSTAAADGDDGDDAALRYELVASAKTGACNHNSVGEEMAKKNLIDAILAVTNQGEALRNGQVGRIVLGLAGVDREQDKVMVARWLADTVPASVSVDVHNDAIPALASGTLGKLHGIVTICGTGMICFGVKRVGDKNGGDSHLETARCGGWGALTDKASGYWIGLTVLARVWASYDGTGDKTSLESAVVERHLKLANTEDLIPWTYDDLSWSRIASLAPLAFAEAAAGDAVALAILEEAAQTLSGHIRTVARKLGFVSHEKQGKQEEEEESKTTPATTTTTSSAPTKEDDDEEEEFVVVFTGGVWNGGDGWMGKRVGEILKTTVPNAKCSYPAVDPAIGSALLAMNH